MPLRGERERLLLIAVAMFIGLTGVIVAPLKMQLEIGDIAMPSDAELKLLPRTAGETSVEEAITLHGPIRGYPNELNSPRTFAAIMGSTGHHRSEGRDGAERWRDIPARNVVADEGAFSNLSDERAEVVFNGQEAEGTV